MNHGDWKKPKRGVEGQEWEVRQHFANNEATMGRHSFDFLMKEMEWSLNLRR